MSVNVSYSTTRGCGAFGSTYSAMSPENSIHGLSPVVVVWSSGRSVALLSPKMPVALKMVVEVVWMR